MTEPDPEFDAVHPSGHLVFRSCRGGYLHSVALAESAMDTDAATLAEAVLRTAAVSHLKAVTQIRGRSWTPGSRRRANCRPKMISRAAQRRCGTTG